MFKIKKKTLIFYAALIAFILLLSNLVPFFRPPFFNLSKVFLSLFSSIRREAGGMIFYHRNLIQKERFRKEVDFLKQELNFLREASQENKRLKELLSLKHKSPFKVIAAAVIGRAPDSWASVIFIDKGSLQGIKNGLPVITYLGVAGRVIETARNTSKIILLSDPDFSVSAIDQRSREEGLVCGALGDFLVMRYLPKDADVKVSDTVVTSGLNGVYPKGLLVGKIEEVSEEYSGLSRYCLIRPAVDLSALEEVLIVMP